MPVEVPFQLDVDAAIGIVKLSIVGLVSGLFSVFVATRDHRFKKWWELRVVAYQSLIEALSDLGYAYEVYLATEERSDELSDEQNEKLRALSRDGEAKLRKVADSGKFLLSAEVIKALDVMNAEQKTQAHSYYESLDNRSYAIKTCRTRIVELSLIDLRLNRHLLLWKVA
jgi:hypothetical protein